MLTLVTRPATASARTIARLEAMGHMVLADPMLLIRPRTAEFPADRFDALTFTSINGVQGFMAQSFMTHDGWPDLFALPVYTVGPRTAEEALAAGFSTVIDCDGDATALTTRMKQDLPPGTHVLYAAGENRAADLPAALEPDGITVRVAVVYAAEGTSALSPQTRTALVDGHIGCVLHFSRRTVVAFLRCVEAEGLGARLSGMRHLCLADQVAGPLVQAGLTVEVAQAPNEDALFALL